MRFKIELLSIAVDHQVSSYFDLDSRFTSKKESSATSHSVFQPGSVDDDRRAANVARRIVRLCGKIAGVDAHNRNSEGQPPTTFAFGAQNRHCKAIGSHCLLTNRA